MNDVVADQLEPGVGEQVSDVLLPPCEEVVHANDIVAACDEAVANVAAQETGSAGDKDGGHEVSKGGGIVGIDADDP